MSGRPPDYVAACAGFLSGGTVRALLQPLDVVKIRWQLQLEAISQAQGGTYRSLTQTVGRILREEGAGALWKGHVPCQIVSVLFNSVQFYTFEKCGPPVRSLLGREGVAANFVCGGLSGVAAAVSCHPFDTLRTRLIGQSESNRVYSGLSHAIAQMWRVEGPRAFYQGLGTNLAMAVSQSGIHFALYSQLRPLLADERLPRPLRSADALVAGCLAGVVAKTAVYPLDVVKKRQQVRGFEPARLTFGRVHTHAGRGAASFALAILRAEGARGLFKGYVPSAIKAGLATGLTFHTYEVFRRAIASTAGYT